MKCPSFLALVLVLLQPAFLSAALVPASAEFHFKEPQPTRWLAPLGWGGNLPTSSNSDWLLAHRFNPVGNPMELGRRILFKGPATRQAAAALLADRPLKNLQPLALDYWVVEAPDAWIACEQAQELARLPSVSLCHPVQRPFLRLQSIQAPAPNDPYFHRQWHLENRDTNSGARLGADIQARAAWTQTRGDGVAVAVVDDGVQMTHPDLADRFGHVPNVNFEDGSNNAGPGAGITVHATAVAGLIAASQSNRRGISGVAPKASLASWVIFDQRGILAPDAVEMSQMFQAHSNQVHVQNHSWGTGGTDLYPLPPLEADAIGNAVTHGRQGRGVVLVRAASNFRHIFGDANADGYATDPRVITVAAARSDGRVANYSNPGTCILVAGLSNEVLPGNGGLDLNYPTLFTTDLVGSAGRNFVFGNSDLSDYRYDNTGFTGTSGATPIISGLVALMLSARPELSYRDVQQALLLSAQHFDREDPLLVQNGAGLEVSLNLGFGVPHAGLAVALAQAWKPRGETQTTSVVAAPNLLIADDGLRIEVSGEGVPAHLMSIPVTSSLGYQAEDGTSEYSLTNAAEALSEWQGDLSGQAVILRRGLNTFAEKIRNMENANPALIIIRDNTGSSDRMIMAGTQRAYIPAVFMARNAGLELEGLIATNPSVRVRLASIKAVVEFDVTEARVCEHVGLRLQTTHTRRGDLRITLVSPLGTRSALQRPGTDSFAGPVDWTYHTVHSFLEPSAGRWRLEVTDEEPGNTGMITRAELIVRGLPIVDTDRDGLSDPWEMDKFGSLDARASDDLDRDGHSNAVEQLLETDPLTSDSPLRLTIEPWRPGVVRVSWPGYRGDSYRILTSSNPDGPYVPEAVVSGAFPETEWFKIVNPSTRHYLRLERLSP